MPTRPRRRLLLGRRKAVPWSDLSDGTTTIHMSSIATESVNGPMHDGVLHDVPCVDLLENTTATRLPPVPKFASKALLKHVMSTFPTYALLFNIV